jgi:poly(3-hydroxyoctanoate) depolymerase
MIERRLEIAGQSLRVREEGEGDPILLVHGLGANLEMWGPVAELWPERRRITLDLPGTGRSSTPLLPLPIPALARIVEGVLDRLGHERVDVLGYSFGGAVSQTFARRAPERVRRLALAGTICGWGGLPGSLPAILTLLLPVRYYSPWVYERTFEWAAGGRKPPPERLRAQAAKRQELPPSLAGYLWQWTAACGWSSLPWLDEIEAPTLVLSGSADPLVPAGNAVILASRIPAAKLFVAEGEGHLFLADPESAALAPLREFFAAPTLDEAPIWRSLDKPSPADREHAIAEHFPRRSAAVVRAAWAGVHRFAAS